MVHAKNYKLRLNLSKLCLKYSGLLPRSIERILVLSIFFPFRFRINGIIVLIVLVCPYAFNSVTNSHKVIDSNAKVYTKQFDYVQYRSEISECLFSTRGERRH